MYVSPEAPRFEAQNPLFADLDANKVDHIILAAGINNYPTPIKYKQLNAHLLTYPSRIRIRKIKAVGHNPLTCVGNS